LAPYLVTLNVTFNGAADNLDVPGVFLATDSTLNMPAPGKASGLFYARGDVNLGATKMVGAVWSQGSIHAPATDFRYFPYYTHAFVNLSGATTPIGAVEQHPIAAGRLP
jgi:hypothetical protein